MKFIIKETVSFAPLPIEIYEIVVTYMHGDADRYEGIPLVLSNDLRELEFYYRFAKDHLHKREVCHEVMTRLLEEFPDCRTIIELKKEHYESGEEESTFPDYFEEWFNDSEWPFDDSSDYQFRASIDSVKVFFYDKEGLKHDVEVVE